MLRPPIEDNDTAKSRDSRVRGRYAAARDGAVMQIAPALGRQVLEPDTVFHRVAMCRARHANDTAHSRDSPSSFVACVSGNARRTSTV